MKKYSNLLIGILLAIAPLPFFASLAHFFSGLQTLKELESELVRVSAKMVSNQALENKEASLLLALKNPDPHYLDKHVETLNFLLPEVKKLEAFQMEHPEDEQIAKRLLSLKATQNRLTFSEEQIRTNELFREVEEKQQRPIEVNEEDLKKLLCLIEGVTIWPYGPKEGRPLFIIKDFTLSKKELFAKEKIFIVSMQLIKRESVE
jgi:hypothetical protein